VTRQRAAGLLLAVCFGFAPVGVAAQEIAGDAFGKRTDNADGTAALTLGHKLTTVWDAKIGIDVALAAEPDPWALPGKPQPLATGAGAGAAWANVALPGLGWDKTVVDARLMPFEEQARLGARMSRNVPIGHDVSLTVEAGYAFVHRLAEMVAAGAASTARPTFEGDRRVAVRFLATKTTVAVGQAYSHEERQWRSTISAEQALFGGPVSLNGSLNEIGGGEYSTALTAAFRRKF
jgi:hypothetical protein